MLIRTPNFPFRLGPPHLPSKYSLAPSVRGPNVALSAPRRLFLLWWHAAEIVPRSTWPHTQAVDHCCVWTWTRLVSCVFVWRTRIAVRSSSHGKSRNYLLSVLQPEAVGSCLTSLQHHPRYLWFLLFIWLHLFPFNREPEANDILLRVCGIFRNYWNVFDSTRWLAVQRVIIFDLGWTLPTL